MEAKGLQKVDASREAELEWKDTVNKLIEDSPRGKVKSWYNGANIPGKPIEHLNYGGGLPLYRKTLEHVRKEGYKGFEFQ